MAVPAGRSYKHCCRNYGKWHPCCAATTAARSCSCGCSAACCRSAPEQSCRSHSLPSTSCWRAMSPCYLQSESVLSLRICTCQLCMEICMRSIWPTTRIEDGLRQCSRGTATAQAQIRCQALALLPHFLEHTAADHQQRVLAGVEHLVSDCFPLSSWEYPPKSTQACCLCLMTAGLIACA